MQSLQTAGCSQPPQDAMACLHKLSSMVSQLLQAFSRYLSRLITVVCLTGTTLSSLIYLRFNEGEISLYLSFPLSQTSPDFLGVSHLCPDPFKDVLNQPCTTSRVMITCACPVVWPHYAKALFDQQAWPPLICLTLYHCLITCSVMQQAALCWSTVYL